jgi:ankyrin repeat protein
MKTKAFVSIPILILAVMVIAGSCETTYKSKRVALFYAVKYGDYTPVKRLIDEGADVNAQDKNGETALIWASKLISVGSPKKDSPVKLVNPEVTRLLIEAGADVNVKANEGYTAFMIASRLGNTEVVQMLKEAGAKE